ncbi:MAG: GNAT family N-acetyltransferase, partial [Acidobacteria bacterium]
MLLVTGLVGGMAVAQGFSPARRSMGYGSGDIGHGRGAMGQRYVVSGFSRSVTRVAIGETGCCCLGLSVDCGRSHGRIVVGRTGPSRMTAIRAAVIGDEERLAKLCSVVQDLHVQSRPDHFRQTQVPELAKWYKSLLEKPTARIWIAEEQGEAVGYVLAMFQRLPENPFTRARAWCEIDQIAVESNHRRRGIGRALVLRAIAEARAEGIQRVE